MNASYIAAPVWFGYSGAALPLPQTRPCILVDLDGTLLNNEHRQVHMQQNPPNWKRFFEEMKHDVAYPEVRFLTNLMFLHTEAAVILITGRPSQYHGMTLQSLHDNGVCFTTLVMRAQTDNRSDVEVKLDMLKGIEHMGFKPMLCIDDRPEVVGMWRERGVPCLQADPRHWEPQIGKVQTLDKLKLLDENERLRARVQELEAFCRQQIEKVPEWKDPSDADGRV